MMNLFLVLFFTFLVICTVVLVAPLSIRFVRSENEKSMRIRWLGIRLSVDTPGVKYALGLPGTPDIVLKRSGEKNGAGKKAVVKKKKSKDREEDISPGADKKKAAKKQNPGSLRLLVEFRKPVFTSVSEFAVLIYRIVLNFSVEQGGMTVRIATQDPALTGMLYGWSQSLAAAVPVIRRRFTFLPDFAGNAVEVDLDMTIRTTVGSHLFDAVVFLARIPKLSMLKLAGRMKMQRSAEKQKSAS